MKMKGMTMGETLIEQWILTPEEKKLFAEEELILECTELICKLMEEKQLSRSQLAQKLGKSKGHITQLLDGRRNMELRTIADIFFAMDSKIELKAKSLTSNEEEINEIAERVETENVICTYTIKQIVKKEPKSSLRNLIPQETTKMAG
ncbi:MAG: helix-turn-helix transcriptional regulator [Phycisphaerae bacterium]|jgi:transcriptional regulator with XRE-family HTH domain|nr:helix-turn-helix transcriptional regulator [Phycisphaerae bacterium]